MYTLKRRPAGLCSATSCTTMLRQNPKMAFMARLCLAASSTTLLGQASSPCG